MRQHRSQQAGRRGRQGIRGSPSKIVADKPQVRRSPCARLLCSAAAEHLHIARSRRSLRENHLRDNGWAALFKALCKNKGDKIESWDLSDEGVGPETAKALAEYISVSPALKSVKYACLPAQCVSPR